MVPAIQHLPGLAVITELLEDLSRLWQKAPHPLAEGPAPAGRGGYNAAPGGTPLAMALPLPNHVGTGGYQAAAAAPVAPASAVATSSVATLAEPNPLGNDHHHGEGDLQDSD